MRVRVCVCLCVYLVSASVGATLALGSISGYAFHFTLCFCLSPFKFYSNLRMCFLAKYNEQFFFILLMFSGIYRARVCVCVWVYVKYNL